MMTDTTNDVQIGFDVSDGESSITRFAVPPEIACAPFFIGRSAEIVLPWPGLLDAHVGFFFDGARLFVTSATAESPVVAGGAPLPTEWVEIPFGCPLQVGTVVLTPFLMEHRADASRATGSVRAPGARAQAASSATAERFTGPVVKSGRGRLLASAAERLARDWKKTSTLVRCCAAALPLVGILLVTRPSHGSERADAVGAIPDLPSEPAAATATETSSAVLGASGVATAAVGTPEGMLMASPSSLPASTRLSAAERASMKRAIDATFTGDYAEALLRYEALAAAHPESNELRAATRILASKLRGPVRR